MDVRQNTLTGSDMQPDSLSGVRIAESSLGQVPSAASANTAGSAGTFGGLPAGAYARNVQYIFNESQSDSTSVKTGFAECPGTKQVIRGGVGIGQSDDENLVATDSRPQQHRLDHPRGRIRPDRRELEGGGVRDLR